MAQNITCSFRESEDGRQGRKRRLDDLAIRAEAFDTLFSSIRSLEDTSLPELRDLARADRPIEEFLQGAQDVQKRNEIRSSSRTRLRRVVISIASLTEIPPIQVPASPWTNVTDDDSAVSHLVSVYFTWSHSAYASLDREIFVRHMVSKDLGSPFCSPFLVNAMLMSASVSGTALFPDISD